MKAKELNGYYYCFSFDEWSHDLYSITEMSRKEAILTAIDNGVRLYLLSIERVNSRGTRKELPLRTWLKEIAPAQLQDRLLYLHHQLRADRQPITLYEI